MILTIISKEMLHWETCQIDKSKITAYGERRELEQI